LIINAFIKYVRNIFAPLVADLDLVLPELLEEHVAVLLRQQTLVDHIRDKLRLLRKEHESRLLRQHAGHDIIVDCL
jgi:hypothetical protein